MSVSLLEPLKTASSPSESDVIKIAVLAVGGQGGGVLSTWIAELALSAGYHVQTTSVAGVAQRTGATIYYIEMAPKSQSHDQDPVFAQSPAPGDVDIMIASELMEAGRAVMRGFVTPDRTTLIASSHRILAVSEKQTPGDGAGSSEAVLEELRKASLKLLCYDLETLAIEAGTVISATLFGALAKSEALPFPAALFEDVIKASGKGVEQNLKAFHSALSYKADTADATDTKTEAIPVTVRGPKHLVQDWNTLLSHLQDLPIPVQDMTQAGLQKVVDYQDIAYGKEYLDIVKDWVSLDHGKDHYALSNAAAKYIANAMCYDDIIRVASLKILASRFSHIRDYHNVAQGDALNVTEYFHPRMEEICSILPRRFGQWVQSRPRLFEWLDRQLNKGRRLRSDRLGGFLALYALSCLKPYRRKLLRHLGETAHLKRLLDLAKDALNSDPDLAIEVLSCQRLIKGYSDTHLRGLSKFDKVIRALTALKERPDAADWIRRLREAALKDEQGTELDGALKTIASFTSSAP